MSRLRAESGFTLIEVLVAMALSGIVFGATLTALEVFQRSNATDILRNEASDNARNAIDRLSRQLRNVAAPSTGYFGALEEAEPYSIAFQTIDNSKPAGESANATNAMRVRYCLDDSKPAAEVVWFQVKRWRTETASPAHAPSGTACPDLSAGDWESTQQLAGYVTNRNGGQNRPLFTYGPGSSLSVSQITTVEPHIYIDVRPGQEPGETQQTTAIQLRNANRQPVASFTATEINGHVLLDASSSEDPDGLALTYRWFEDGKELTTSSQKYETPEKLLEGSVHVYKLEVTDPGGLINTAEHEVKIKKVGE
jgi:prepilin-type N-terminal cleavage/methylation domain-containing protein